ncbi:pantoate--beta-alanine ligase [Saccharibacillus sp. CPCC 101409]|uniref:pantoate--beta-alanine ligase n=1 Tax=Saccharibacillus sp. CPCC 101409 TaxID=3058041 RepID=UPI0026734607|nr:pantoate--beta-alanine ligase [Saccharibacillus sp. CPCC 101409]MDO3409641.1 pantoate--beta-alanine ligase [Saccharibacillus sp. CPCC 101409]
MNASPQIARTIAEVRGLIERLRAERAGGESGNEVGFVPTMGYLHEGHASLLRRARRENGITALSIFVNPIQFGPNEDLERYPRSEEADLELAAREGVDVVFLPSAQEMYPAQRRTTVAVTGVTERLCGASRPGHFDGVATVVSKLFNIVKPDKAYFGAKDAQQVAVLQKMVSDLNMDVRIVPCPIVREADGLALSSRNVYLSEEQRREALVLSRSLREASARIESEAEVTPEQIVAGVTGSIQASPLAQIDYVELLTFPELQPLDPKRDLSDLRDSGGSVILALAVKFGSTRLIDNAILNLKEAPLHV